MMWTKTFSKHKHQQFVATVWRYYQDHKRAALPWRHTHDPYRIVVSECMLQQTQVARVIPKYRAFLKAFPNTKQLANSSLAQVLQQWQGLGYNRRAKLLHECAVCVHTTYRGRWPKSSAALESLPGIGPYTAAAVAAFAYNQPAVCIETNIRTAIIHHYFPQQFAVSESAIRSVVTETLVESNPREWYWALMDYGAYVKQVYGNHNQQAQAYQKQTPFAGSDREIRGAVIRLLTQQPLISVAELTQLGFLQKRVSAQCQALVQEGLIEPVGTQNYQLRS